MDTPETRVSQPGLFDYLGVIRRRRRLAVGLGGPIALIGLLFALGLPGQYQSSSLIEIEKAKEGSYLPSSTGEATYLDQYVASLKERVLTATNMRAWARELRPYPELAADESAAAARMQRDIDVEIVTTPILDPESGHEREIITAFTVSGYSRDPALAQRLAERVTDAFLSINRSSGSQKATRESDFLAVEAERFRKRIGEVESQIASFKAKNYGRLPELTESNLSMMDRAESDQQNIEVQIQSLRRERLFLVQQLGQARSASVDDTQREQLQEEYKKKSAIYDPNHPDLIMLRRQIDSLRNAAAGGGTSLRAQLQSQRSALAQASQRYSEDHPDVRRLRREIEQLEARIAAGETSDPDPSGRSPVYVQINTQINGIDNQIMSLQARSAELRARVREFEQRIQATPEVERDYQKLTRDLELARQKYDELLKRQMDAEVSAAAIEGGAVDEFRLVQAPGLPTAAARPPRLAIGAIGVLLAIVIALSAAFIGEATDPSIRGKRDVESLLDMAPLAIIPRIENSLSHRRRVLQTTAYAVTVAVASVVLVIAMRQIA